MVELIATDVVDEAHTCVGFKKQFIAVVKETLTGLYFTQRCIL